MTWKKNIPGTAAGSTKVNITVVETVVTTVIETVLSGQQTLKINNIGLVAAAAGAETGASTRARATHVV